MIKMKKKILLVLLVLATVLPAGAVLKEANMEQTLGVLCEELSEAHKKQRERAKRFEQRNKPSPWLPTTSPTHPLGLSTL